jgi:hypothetical protein
LEFKDTRKEYEEPEIVIEQLCARYVSRAVANLNRIRLRKQRLLHGIFWLGFVRTNCAEVRKMLVRSFLLVT